MVTCVLNVALTKRIINLSEPTPFNIKLTLNSKQVNATCIHVFCFIRNMILRNMSLRLQVLLNANSGNIEENEKTQSINR